MSVAIDKPYPYVVNKSYPGTWRPHDKLLPDKSSDQLLAAKTSSSGFGYEKYTHCHAHICLVMFTLVIGDPMLNFGLLVQGFDHHA